MKSMALKLITFLDVITMTQSSMADDELNKFDLRNYKAMDRLIDSLHEEEFVEMTDVQDLTYRRHLINQVLEGENIPGICQSGTSAISCEEELNQLTGNARLREILNRGKGEYVRLRTTPQAGPYQVQNLFSLHTRKDQTGLIFYVAVAGDGYRRAGLPDYVKSTFGIGDDTEHKSSQGGVILLLKFR